jgi:hypothetical protein
MGVRDIVRALVGNAGKSVQLQAEIRAGIANQADLFNRKMTELIKLQTDQSARNEAMLAQLSAAMANQTQVLNQRLRELIQQQVNADARKEQFFLELWSRRFDATAPHPNAGEKFVPAPDYSVDISVAPLQSLPIPQISLRRPNPVADLMATREFKTYLDFFLSSPSVSRAGLTAEAHAILYAFIRKIKPAQALVAFRDGAVVSETIARGLCDNGAGLLHLFDDLEDSRTSAILDQWPDALRPLCVLESGIDMPIDLKSAFALIGGEDAENTIPDLADSLNALVEPGGLLVLMNVSRNSLRKLMSGRPEWRELGKDHYEGVNRPDLEAGPFVFLREAPASAVAP